MALLSAALCGCFAGDFGVPVRDTGPRTSTEPGLVHIVRRGDTLYSIAWDAGLDFRALARWNDIRAPYVIRPGQKLRLRPGPERGRISTASTKPAARPAESPDPAPVARGNPNPAADVGSGKGWTWPADGTVIRRFSPDAANPGIDIAGEAGQTVKSAADGRVVYSGDGLRGYGQLVIVKHNEIYLSAYAHNEKLLVKEGETVRRGQPIAKMGSTGTNRVKLHFEIRKQGTAVDPLRYLPTT